MFSAVPFLACALLAQGGLASLCDPQYATALGRGQARDDHGSVALEHAADHRQRIGLVVDEQRPGAVQVQGAAHDLVSPALQSACSELERLVGMSTPEDVLDRIFRKFCLGK